MSHALKSMDRYARAQDVLSGLVDSVRGLNLPELGPAYCNLSGIPLRDALVAHRLTNKFVIPSSDGDDERARISIQRMVLEDNLGPRGPFDWFSLKERTRLDLIRVKHEIHELLKEFKLPRTASRFPSGESCFTTHGEVSFSAKFTLDSQWTCGAGCVAYVADLFHNTAALKKILKERCDLLYPKGFFDDGKGGYQNTLRRFKAVTDIAPGRIATVPKDNEWDRVISMEPTFSMVAQLQLSKGLRRCLEAKWGYKIENRADLHGLMIKLEGSDTIDLKNASNSNWYTIVRALWPRQVFKYLDAFRSDVLTYKGKGNKTEYWKPNMLSPMGNGFTFEVMTITLLAMVRCFDPLGSVFGDDIIIRNTPTRFLDLLQVTGWQINTKKTFMKGNFRESCGQFYSKADKEYLLSYDLWYPIDDIDGIVAGNKLYLLLQTELGSDLRSLILSAYCELLKIYFEFAIPPQDTLRDDGFFSPFVWGLRVNGKHDHMFDALYQRRVSWRLDINVSKTSSKVLANPWVDVASRLLGRPEKEPSRERRKTYVRVVDSMSGLTHQGMSQLFLTELK